MRPKSRVLPVVRMSDVCPYLWVYVGRMSVCPYLWVYVGRMSVCPYPRGYVCVYLWVYVRTYL